VNPGIRLGYKADGTPRIYRGDAHLLTIAPTRAGKGTDLLIPALLTYEGSTIVVDPKGQLACVTSRRRQEMGQEVLLLNPFKIWPDYIGDLPHVGFNPLAGLVGSSELSTDCETVTDAIVVQQEGGGDNSKFFNEGARQLITGLMMRIIESPTSIIHSSEKNLVRLYKMVSGNVYEHAQEAEQNSKNELIKARLNRFAEKDAAERKSTGDIVSTAKGECNFIGSEALVESLKGDARELRFRELRRKPMTVYLILPTERLGPCAKWFRLVVEAALFDLMHDLEKGGPGLPVLMMMDEFAQLKRLQIIEEALAGAAGYGVILWPVLQDLTQLQELYNKRWETFIGNAGISMWFAPAENTTADYVSKKCGETEVGFEDKHYSSQPLSRSPDTSLGVNSSYQRIARRVLLPEEVCGYGDERRRLRKDEMLVFMRGMANLIRGKRRSYLTDPEMRGLASPDPYHPPHGGPQLVKGRPPQPQAPSPVESNRPGEYRTTEGFPYPVLQETREQRNARIERQQVEWAEEERRGRRWWQIWK
jgi:type IV secretion system protein VirD4